MANSNMLSDIPAKKRANFGTHGKSRSSKIRATSSFVIAATSVLACKFLVPWVTLSDVFKFALLT